MLNKTSPKVIAAFDFDGTLTHRDLFFPFLIYASKKTSIPTKLLKIIPNFILYGLGNLNRQEVKERLIYEFLHKKSKKELYSIGEEFAKVVIPKYEREITLNCLKWHQSQGHECVIVSAGLNFYLQPWTLSKGITSLISSELNFDASDAVIGTLKNGNCWGEEKVKRLTDRYGNKDNYILYAYGDSKGDEPLLQLADFAYYKNWPVTQNL